MARHLCFYNNDTLLQDNSDPGYFTEFNVPADTNLIVCYDDDYKITCNIRVTSSSNQDMFNYQYATDSALFLLSSIQNYTQNQTVRAQLTVSNIAKDSNNLAQDIQNYLQNCGVASGSIDFSSIVTALNSIATALSALTNLNNLSNLSQLANIITAINHKDNQSDIVSSLNNIFCYNNGYSCIKQVQLDNNSSTTETTKRYSSLLNCLNRLTLVFTKLKSGGIAYDIDNNDKLLTIVSDLLSTGGNPVAQSGYNSIQALSIFKSISDKLDNIYTKLEQNLPFTTLAQVDVVTDYTQVVKGVGKNE